MFGKKLCKNMPKIIISSLFFFVFSLVCYAQNDSLLINWEQLSHTDIEQKEANNEKKIIVLSANRVEEELNPVPYTIYVIMKEEIRDMGYSTLVDVLKRLPGMKISKHGSAVLGEMFSTRGLQGNSAFKVLINDIPITSLAAPGITIGAQLPIKNAERIEICYNTGGVIYNENTLGGTINIITLKSERPAYATAELKNGVGNYAEINAAFGGKFGRGKKIFTFSIYGNYTTYENHNNYWYNSKITNGKDYHSMYNIKNYLEYEDSIGLTRDINKLLSFYEKNDNAAYDIRPHISSSIGGFLKYRNFSFTYDGMSRRDHSALGANPAAISSSDLGTFYEDFHENFNINWTQKFRKFEISVNALLKHYYVSQESSTNYIHPFLLRKSLSYVVNELGRDAGKTYDNLRKDFFAEKTYGGSNSADRIFDVKLAWKINEHIYVNGGIKANSNDIYYNNSYITNKTITYNQLEKYGSDLITASFWGNAIFKYKKFYGNAGYSVVASSGNVGNDELVNNYRVGLSYSLFKKLTIFGNVSASSQVISTYYDVRRVNFSDAVPNTLRFNSSGYYPAQNLKNIEFGVRSLSNQLNFDIFKKWHANLIVDFNGSAYMMNYNNLYDQRIQAHTTSLNEKYTIYEYSVDVNSFQKTKGFQANLVLKNFFHKPENQIILSSSYASYHRKLFGKEKYFLPEIPEFITQLRVAYSPIRNFIVIVDATHYGRTEFVRINKAFKQISDPFFPSATTIDLMLRYRFSKNFQAYFKINNATNQEMMGLSNITNVEDNLFYNAQSHTQAWIGLNYTLE